MISVVIPTRLEPRLADTVRRIRETQGKHDVEIVVVLDGIHDIRDAEQYIDRVIVRDQYGIHACRDAGIMDAANDCIVMLDAHMNFRDEDWLSGLCKRYRQGARELVCGCSVGLCKTTYQFAADCEHCDKMRTDLQGMGAKAPQIQPPRYGAWIDDKDEHRLISGFNENRVLPSRWLHDGPGKVGSILGACYCFSRDWYIDMGRPWKYMRQWGTSEQAISLINYCMGGECYAVDQKIGHLYRRGGEVPYVSEDREEHLQRLSGIWFNRYWLLTVLPMSDSLRAEMLEWLDGNHVRSGVTRRVQEWLDEYEVKAYAQQLRRQSKRTLDDYFNEWGD